MKPVETTNNHFASFCFLPTTGKQYQLISSRNLKSRRCCIRIRPGLFVFRKVTSRILCLSCNTARETVQQTKKNESYYGWNREAWLRGWETQEKETQLEWDTTIAQPNDSIIQGHLPSDIKGTLFRNGPAKFRVGSYVLRHPWDGDGMIAAITFDEGRIWFRNRYIRTKGYLEEQKHQTIRYRGVFGTQIPGGWWNNFLRIKTKNVANTNVLLWNNRLFALWEGGLPYELDPGNLITLGEKRLHVEMEPNGNFTAHPKIERASGRLIGFSGKLGLNDSQITFYEWDAAFSLISKRTITIPGFGFYHDFTITDNYYILFQGPVDFQPLKYVLGVCSAAECMQFQADKPAKIYCIPRKSGAPVKTISVKSGFVFHFANAFENNDGEITIDTVRTKELYLGDISKGRNKNESITHQVDYENQVPPSSLYRYKIDVRGSGICKDEHVILQRQVEFPSVHPSFVGKKHRWIYMSVSAGPKVSPVQGVAKVDSETGYMEQWTPTSYEYAAEPIFVAAQNGTGDTEDEGYLITLVYDGRKHLSYYAILDAKNVQDSTALIYSPWSAWSMERTSIFQAKFEDLQ